MRLPAGPIAMRSWSRCNRRANSCCRWMRCATSGATAACFAGSPAGATARAGSSTAPRRGGLARRAWPVSAVPSDTRWPPTTRMRGPARRTAPGCAAPAQRAGDLAAWNAALPAEPVGFRPRLLLAEGGWPAQRPSRGGQDAAEGGRTGVCRRSGHRQGSRSSPRSARPRACSPNVPATITTSSNWSYPRPRPRCPRADAGRPVPRPPPITADPRAAPPCPRPTRRHCRAPGAALRKIPPACPPSGDAPRRPRLIPSSRNGPPEHGGATSSAGPRTWRLAKEMTVKQTRIQRPRARRERPWREALPPDPRDPDVVRAKALARSGHPRRQSCRAGLSPSPVPRGHEGQPVRQREHERRGRATRYGPPGRNHACPAPPGSRFRRGNARAAGRAV